MKKDDMANAIVEMTWAEMTNLSGYILNHIENFIENDELTPHVISDALVSWAGDELAREDGEQLEEGL